MIADQGAKFDIPRGVTYLNCAYLSPLLRASVEAGKAGIARKAQPWTIHRDNFFTEVEHVRNLFARLINAPPDAVALVPASSYATAIAAANLDLQGSQSIVALESERFSNVYKWKPRCRETGAKLIMVPEPEHGGWTQSILDRIDHRTAVVSVPQCHWHDGRLVDLAAVADATRAVGAALIVDGTQSIGAMRFDVHQVRPAFAFCSAYKWLLGPYGLAFLYVAREYQNGHPLEHHGYNRLGADQASSTVGYTDKFMEGARRYDFGERSNFILLPMMSAALNQVLEWGPDNIQRTIAPLIADINRRGQALELRAPEQGVDHFTGLRVKTGRFSQDLQKSLSDAHVHVSLRGKALRISPYLYNSSADVDRLFEVLERALRR